MFFASSWLKSFRDVAQMAGNGVVVEIVVRKGQSGVAYVHPFPHVEGMEYEVLLNRRRALKVLRADDQVIRLEVWDGDDE